MINVKKLKIFPLPDFEFQFVIDCKFEVTNTYLFMYFSQYYSYIYKIKNNNNLDKIDFKGQ